MSETVPQSCVADAPTLYSWVITLQYPMGSGFRVITHSGTYPSQPGASRTEAYRAIRDAIARVEPRAATANVLFLSLEPDRL
ncbi:hypothetical protein [Kitasatospora sp. NPDC059327]|uniref:hypothetical protein n=1 Tax=Kitasatospora sp. NPDC059327 TaxID=3346803 RepID=UPI00367ED218